MSEREGKVYEALEKRFPNIPPGELKEKSCAIAKESQEEVWKGIVSKLAEENKNEDPTAVFKRFRLKLNPKMLDKNEEETHMEHLYVAAYHFHKMALKWAVDDFAPLPLRTLSKPEDAIDYAKLGKNGQSNDFVFYETQTNRQSFGFLILPHFLQFFLTYAALFFRITTDISTTFI